VERRPLLEAAVPGPAACGRKYWLHPRGAFSFLATRLLAVWSLNRSQPGPTVDCASDRVLPSLSRVASLRDRPAPAPTMSTFGALQCQLCRTKRYLANPDDLGCRRSGMVRVTFTTDRGSLSAMCSANRPLSLATTRTSGIGALARRLSDTLNPSFCCALPWVCFEPVPFIRRVANACPSNQTVGVLFPERPFPSADTPCRTDDAIHRHTLLTFLLKSVQRSLCAG